MNADKGLTTQLSQRIGPQRAIAVPIAEASVGAGTTGNPAHHAVLVEDVTNIQVYVTNTGANATSVCKVQANDLTPDDTDANWIDFAGGAFGVIGAGGNATITIQSAGHRWFRLRAGSAAGGTTIDLAWTGS
jgi:hypothetical protein